MKYLFFCMGLIYGAFAIGQGAIKYINGKPAIVYDEDTVYGKILTYRYYYGNSYQYYDFERYSFNLQDKIYSYYHQVDSSLHRNLWYAKKLNGGLLFDSYTLWVKQNPSYPYSTTHTSPYCNILIPGQHLSWSALFVLDSIPARKKYCSHVGEIWVMHVKTRNSSVYKGYMEFFYTPKSAFASYSIVYVPKIGIVRGFVHDFLGLRKRSVELIKINGETISDVLPSLNKSSSPCDVFLD